MNYKITNLEYGTGPWGTEMLYGGIGNPKPGETENNVHSVTLLEDDAGKVHMLEGDVEDVLPGISLHVVRECHSVAEQLVVVDTARGKFIVGGDIACRPANVFGTDEWPGYLVPVLGRSGSARLVCGAYQWIRERLDGDASCLVLTHDVTMHERFETEGLEGLAIHYVVRQSPPPRFHA